VTRLICLHGFTGSPRSWEFLGRTSGPPLLAPALVGHHGSTAGDEIAGFEDEVDRLATLATEPGHWVGYSLGARLALGVALRHPRRVLRLTLISGHPGLATAAERVERQASDAGWCELLQARGLTAFVDAWQAQALWASQARLPAAIREQKRQERLSHSAPGLCRSLRVTGLATMPDFMPNLAQIRVPTEIVAGELDPKFCALGKLLADHIASARLTLVPDAGHDLLLERPELITELIRSR
jgi:2-succinyl-6-hydroxy-2,4-cyclohexadiene-1-carboxylate synthase